MIKQLLDDLEQLNLEKNYSIGLAQDIQAAREEYNKLCQYTERYSEETCNVRQGNKAFAFLSSIGYYE